MWAQRSSTGEVKVRAADLKARLFRLSAVVHEPVGDAVALAGAGEADSVGERNW
jgi:hypothetical protein